VEFNPITVTDYNNALMAAGSLKRQGFPDLAKTVEDAAREIRVRLEEGE
jgi:hypothetical protein